MLSFLLHATVTWELSPEWIVSSWALHRDPVEQTSTWPQLLGTVSGHALPRSSSLPHGIYGASAWNQTLVSPVLAFGEQHKSLLGPDWIHGLVSTAALLYLHDNSLSFVALPSDFEI